MHPEGGTIGGWTCGSEGKSGWMGFSFSLFLWPLFSPKLNFAGTALYSIMKFFGLLNTLVIQKNTYV